MCLHMPHACRFQCRFPIHTKIISMIVEASRDDHMCSSHYGLIKFALAIVISWRKAYVMMIACMIA